MPGGNHGRSGLQGKRDYFKGRPSQKDLSPPHAFATINVIGSLDLFFWWLQEDTFEEEAPEERETCDDWQQLQKLGLWDVVCGSGIQFKGFQIRAKEPTFKLMQCQKRNTAQPDTILFPPGLIATVKAVNKLKPWQTNKAVKPDIDSGY